MESAVLTAGDSPLVLLQHLPIHLRAFAVRSRVEDRNPAQNEATASAAAAAAPPPRTGEPGAYDAASVGAAAFPAGLAPGGRSAGDAELPGRRGRPARGPLSWKEFQETVPCEQKRAYLLALLGCVDGSVPEAARIAGLSRQRLYTLLRDHGIARQ